MKKIIYIILLFPLFLLGQSNSENYVKTIKYKKELIGNYQDISVNITSSNVIINTMGGGSGNVSILNNILTFNFSATWGVSTRLKLGNIKQINCVPMIANFELGPLLVSGIPSGYFAKIKNNWLVFYSPYFPNSMSINTTTSIPGGSVISNYTISTGAPYACPSGQSGGGGGTIVINRNATSGTISLNVSGGWSELCALKTFPTSLVTLNATYTIPDTELGLISGGDFNTVYKARIKNNKLEFYSDEIIPTMPTSCNIQFSNNFSGNPQDKEEVVTYYDGIGRPIQIIQSKKSPNQKDIITHVGYDPFGRQNKEYMPYSKWYGVSDMEFVSAAKLETLYYYSSFDPDVQGNPQFETTLYPFSEVEFESSTLGRIKQSGSPGNDWAIPLTSSDPDHTVKYENSSNVTNEVRKFKIVFGLGTTENHTLEVDGFYQLNKLSKEITKNENWKSSDGLNKTEQKFYDDEGKMVLKRTFNNSLVYNTYYCYDIYGNLSYIVPPLASDAIDATYGTQAVVNRSYPWTAIAIVDGNLAQEYNKLFSDYKNEFIADTDLYNKYGGQGGFSLSTDNDNDLVFSLNINVQEPLELKNGEIVSLKEFGNFNDVELGKIVGVGFEYYFIIQNNALVVRGRGRISSVNQTFFGNSKLVYNYSIPWAALVDIDSKEAQEYLDLYTDVDNENILSYSIPNNYGASGGINIAIDENDVVSINLNVNSQLPLQFKKGIVIPLKIERRIEDREFGVFETNNYKYIFSIKENSLFIEGTGEFNNILRAPIVDPPATLAMPMTIVEGLCYQYRYDYRNRLIEKRVPGKGWEYIVFDKLGRPVLTQDPNTRLNNTWHFVKYDGVGRIIFTGEFNYISLQGNTNSLLRVELQNIINSSSSLYESYSSLGFVNGNVNINYTNNNFPNSTNTNFNILTVIYYDSYNFNPFGTSVAVPSSVYSNNTSTNVKSFETGSLVRVLGTNSWIFNLNAYDKYARLIWNKSENYYLNTIDITEMKIDFVGKVLESKNTHNKSGAITNLVVIDKFTYDNADRLLKHTQKVDSNIEELIEYNKYDELGYIIKKKVGGVAPASTVVFDNVSTQLQTIDYSFNVRGWLKKINDPDSAFGDDLFAFKLNYNEALPGTVPLFNGNISQTSWKTVNDNKLRKYNYTYDDLDQLTNANYVGNYPLVLYPTQTESYSENNIQYDKNGNITHLERTGLKNISSPNPTIDVIDNLTYVPNTRSNKIKQVIDFSFATEGFSDDNNSTIEDFNYDINGNMTSDTNKGITNIAYNYLNLPNKVIFNFQDPDSSTQPKGIKYVYDALGNKLEKKIYETNPINFNVVVTTINYDGSYVYKNNQLQHFGHDQGYVSKNGSNYEYVYQYKDHLGNVRLSYKKNTSGTIDLIEENNYYPFGLKHQGYNPVYIPVGNDEARKINYNSKELQNELGLNWYDYGARNYDPALGRWLNIDRIADVYRAHSPYCYALNNPVFFIDPDGNEPTPYEAALMASHVYENSGRLVGGWRQLESSYGYNIDDKKTGFKAAMYARVKEDGTEEFAYVFAGSVGLNDWGGNLSQVVGLSKQYRQAANKAIDLDNYLGDQELTFVGHSLGGGLSNLSSMVTGRTSITFNPAWLSSITKDMYSGGKKSLKGDNHVTNFVHQSDPLDELQGLLGRSVGLKEYGETVEVDGGLFSNAVLGHTIGEMISRIEKNGFGYRHEGNKSDKIVKDEGAKKKEKEKGYLKAFLDTRLMRNNGVRDSDIETSDDD